MSLDHHQKGVATNAEFKKVEVISRRLHPTFTFAVFSDNERGLITRIALNRIEFLPLIASEAGFFKFFSTLTVENEYMKVRYTKVKSR